MEDSDIQRNESLVNAKKIIDRDNKESKQESLNGNKMDKKYTHSNDSNPEIHNDRKVIILKLDNEGNLRKENIVNDNKINKDLNEETSKITIDSFEKIIADKPTKLASQDKNEKDNNESHSDKNDKIGDNDKKPYGTLMDNISPETSENTESPNNKYQTSEKLNDTINDGEIQVEMKRRVTYAIDPEVEDNTDNTEPYLIRSNSLPNLLPSQIYTSFSSEQSSNANTPVISSRDLISEEKLNQEILNKTYPNDSNAPSIDHVNISSSEISLSNSNVEVDLLKKKYYHEKSKLGMDNLDSQKSPIVDATPVNESENPSKTTEKDMKVSSDSVDSEKKKDSDELPEYYRNPWIFLKSEIFGEDAIPEKLSELKKERIQNFLAVPVELEKFLNYGILICLDSFLYTFTILPIRLIVAVFCMFKGIFIKNAFKTRHKSDILKGLLMLFCCIALQYIDVSRLYHFVRGQNIVKLYLIYNLMENFDKLCSAFGHDVLDSLFAENIIKKSNRGSRFPVIVHFVVALTYLILHTVVLFYLVVSLNVAINSYNNALLSFLISNQFGEIKSAVFKRFERENLFQLTCADIVERFQILVFLVIITCRNFLELTGTGAETLSHFYTLFSKSILSPASFSSVIPKLNVLQTLHSSNFPEFCEKIVNLVVSWFTNFINSPTYQLLAVLITPLVVIYGSEMFVDYLKHTFITKFNQIKPSVYTKYRDSLCKDFAGAKKFSDNQILDRSGYVSRRIGFVTIPLACLTIRIIMQTLKMFGYLYIDDDSLHSFSIHNFFKEDGSFNIRFIKRFSINIAMIISFLCFVYIFTLIVKLYLSLYIHKISFKRVQEMKKEKENEAAAESKKAEMKQLVEEGPVDYHQYQRQPNDIPPQRDDKLDKIDRYMMVKSRIP